MRHIQAFLFDLDETRLRGSLPAHREAWNIAIHDGLPRQGTMKADEPHSLPGMEFFFEQEGQSNTIITALLLKKLGFSSNQQLVN